MRTALFCAFLAVCAACQSGGGVSRILTTDVFDDIPAPRTARVKTDEARSFSHEQTSGAHRCAQYVYQYVGESEEAVAFFEQTMSRPPYSWELVKIAELTAGHDQLTYRKGDETCVVDIRTTESKDDEGDDITITIRVNYQ